MTSTLSSESSSSTSSTSSLVPTTTTSFISSTVSSISSTSVATTGTIATTGTEAVFSTITISATATATATNLNASGTSKSHLSSGTIAGVVIGGLLAGFIVGGCIVLFLLAVRRRLRQRRSAVGTQPEERLMHLERMRGETAPPLREGSAIQSLPPSRNIRVLNWLARTRNAGPPSVTQHTMSERSVHEDRRSATSVPLPDSNSQSHYSQPSLDPHRSNTQRSSSTVVRPTQSNSRTSFIAMDNGIDNGRLSRI
ncbi:hypothetical protein F5050DRAFT_1805165 [Lentinula boryana]|uniref:Uncharacterized protein n=1 Tax=Lentinula boryana TaxID=40481 RepID=A0ABQ8QLT6_9AGAR|nr:hypothetical protein F5050DRAFT_1805165 [Lentinula boryana]